MLLLLGANEKTKAISELFEISLVVPEKQELRDGTFEYILIDYSYSDFTNKINLVPEPIKKKTSNDNLPPTMKISLDSFLVFARGPAAGTGELVGKLIFNRHHVKLENDFQEIRCASNIILISEKKSSNLAPGFGNLLLNALFSDADDWKKKKDTMEQKAIIDYINIKQLKQTRILVPTQSMQLAYLEAYEANLNENDSRIIRVGKGINEVLQYVKSSKIIDQ
jgi:hypothetical protein